MSTKSVIDAMPKLKDYKRKSKIKIEDSELRVFVSEEGDDFVLVSEDTQGNISEIDFDFVL